MATHTSTDKRRWGSVELQPSGMFRARPRGHRTNQRLKARMFSTYEEADEWLAEVRVALAKGTLIDARAGKIPLREFFETFLQCNDLEESTILDYRCRFRTRIDGSLGHRPLNEITVEEIKGWWVALKKTHPTTRSSNAKAYRLLQTLCNDAVDSELIARSPCRIKGAGREHPKERPVVTLELAAALADAMPAHMRVVVSLGIWSQLRLGEILGLRRCDIDLDAAEIHVRQAAKHLTTGAIRFGTPKEESRRTLVMPEPLRQDLAEHLERFVKDGPYSLLVTGAKGGPLRPQVLGPAFRTALEGVGLPKGTHIHDLRHSGATLYAQSGATLKETMSQLGHRSQRAALIYQHAVPQRARINAAAMSELGTQWRRLDTDTTRESGGAA